MLSEVLGQALQRARKQIPMSREELARRAHVSVRLVAEVERGDRPNVSLETFLRLLGIVGVSIVAEAPAGWTEAIQSSRTAALGRAARAAQRRQTWTGRHVHLRNSSDPPHTSATPAARVADLSRVSKEAYALSSNRR